MSSYRNRGRDGRERSNDRPSVENVDDIDDNEGLRITIANDRPRSSRSNTSSRDRRSRSPSENRRSSYEYDRSRRSPDRRSGHRRPVEERLGPSPNRYDRDPRRDDYYRNRDHYDTDRRDRDFRQEMAQKMTSRWDDDSAAPPVAETSVIEGIAPENSALAQLLGPVLSTLASAKRTAPAGPQESLTQNSSVSSKPLKSILKSKRFDTDDSANSSPTPSFQSSFQPVAATAAAAANLNPEAVLQHIDASHTPFSMNVPNSQQPQQPVKSLFPIVRDSPLTRRKSSEDQERSRTLPGLSVYSDEIDDEEMFLYGGPGPVKAAKSLPVSSYDNSSNGSYQRIESRFRDESNSNSMNPVAFPPGTNPSSSFPPAIFSIPTAEEAPKAEEKPHDPTIENILKSIGFNFDLSKKIQDMKNKERTKKEPTEPPSYGINQMASFLSGGLSKTEIDSAFPKKEEIDNQALKNEQLAMVDDLIRDAKLNVMASKREYKTSGSGSRSSSAERSPSPVRNRKSSQQKRYEESSPEQNRSPSRSPERRRNNSSSERKRHRRSRSYNDKRRDSRSSSRDRRSESRGNNRRSRRSRSRSKSVEKPQFPLTAQPPFPPFGFPPFDGPPHGFNPFTFPPPGFIPPSGYQGFPPPPPFGFPPGSFPYGLGPPAQTSEFNSYSSAPQPTQPTYTPSTVSSDVSTTNSSANLRVLTEESSQKTEKEIRQEREEKMKALSLKAKEEIAAEMARKNPKSNKPSNRKVIPPKQEPQHYFSPSPPPTEIRTVKAVPIPAIGSEERKKLERERDEREKRLKALEKQLEKLRKQQNEMMRKKARQRGGDKDPLFAENSKLQEDIAAQISALRKAAEENAGGFFNRSADPRSMRDSLQKEDIDNKDDKSVKEEQSNFVYFDGGNYWCRQCNSIHKTIFDYFNHLHSKGHTQGMDKYNVPWLPESLKNPKVEPMKDVQMLPMRGVEFLMPCTAYYCSLCNEFSGDAACAEGHVKGKSHNAKYVEHLIKLPFYERTLNMDKWAALGSQKQADETSDKKPISSSLMKISEDSSLKKIKDEQSERSYERNRKRNDDDRRSRGKDYREENDNRIKERERSSSRQKEQSKTDDQVKDTSKGLKLTMKLQNTSKEIRGRKDEIHSAFNLEEDDDDQDEETVKEEVKETRTVSIKPKLQMRAPKRKFEEKKPIAQKSSGFLPLNVSKKTEKSSSLTKARKDVKDISLPAKTSSQKPMPAFVGKHLSMSLKRKTRADLEAERKKMKEESENKIPFGPAPKPEGADVDTKTITITAKKTYDMFGDNDAPAPGDEEVEVRTIRIEKKLEEQKNESTGSKTKTEEINNSTSSTSDPSITNEAQGQQISSICSSESPAISSAIPLPTSEGTPKQSSSSEARNAVITAATYSSQQKTYPVPSTGYQTRSSYNQTPVNTSVASPLQYGSTNQAPLAFPAQYAHYPVQQQYSGYNSGYPTPNFPQPPPFPLPFQPGYPQAPPPFPPPFHQNYQGGYNDYQSGMSYGQSAPRGPMRPPTPHPTGPKHQMKFQGPQCFNKTIEVSASNNKPKKTKSNIVTIETSDIVINEENDGTPDEGLLPPGVDDVSTKKQENVKPGKIALKLKPKNTLPCPAVSTVSGSDLGISNEIAENELGQSTTTVVDMEIDTTASGGHEEEPGIPGID